MKPLLGLSLQPDRAFLEQTRRIAEEYADFFEVTPDSTWKPDLTPLARQETLLEIGRRSGKPFTAHGVELSLGSTGIDGRFERWLEAIRRDHAVFRFEWYSEHLGFTEHEGLNAALPLPLPMTDEAVRAAAARLKWLKGIVPNVAFENSANYCLLGDPREEPDFFNAICAEADCGLLLDLHNAYTECLNFRIDLADYLPRIDLDRVIEIHLSGGSESDPGWLRSGRVFRLDSHDGPVPEPVWKAFEWTLPRCPNLRGVVVERIDLGLAPEQVPEYENDFRRAREILC